MERLVYKDSNGYIQIKDCENKMCYEICDDYIANCDKCIMTKILKLVSDYQDTKLQPEQVEKLKEKNKTLAKENRKLKKEMLKMMNYSWYNQEDGNEQE